MRVNKCPYCYSNMHQPMKTHPSWKRLPRWYLCCYYCGDVEMERLTRLGVILAWNRMSRKIIRDRKRGKNVPERGPVVQTWNLSTWSIPGEYMGVKYASKERREASGVD